MPNTSCEWFCGHDLTGFSTTGFILTFVPILWVLICWNYFQKLQLTWLRKWQGLNIKKQKTRGAQLVNWTRLNTVIWNFRKEMLRFTVQKWNTVSVSHLLYTIGHETQYSLRNLRPTLKDQKPETLFCHIERTLENKGFIIRFWNNTNLLRQSWKLDCVLLWLWKLGGGGQKNPNK